MLSSRSKVVHCDCQPNVCEFLFDDFANLFPFTSYEPTPDPAHVNRGTHAAGICSNYTDSFADIVVAYRRQTSDYSHVSLANHVRDPGILADLNQLNFPMSKWG